MPKRKKRSAATKSPTFASLVDEAQNRPARFLRRVPARVPSRLESFLRVYAQNTLETKRAERSSRTIKEMRADRELQPYVKAVIEALVSFKNRDLFALGVVQADPPVELETFGRGDLLRFARKLRRLHDQEVPRVDAPAPEAGSAPFPAPPVLGDELTQLADRLERIAEWKSPPGKAGSPLRAETLLYEQLDEILSKVRPKRRGHDLIGGIVSECLGVTRLSANQVKSLIYEYRRRQSHRS